MKGKTPTRKEAIETHCWQCMGFYQDGKNDCENVKCPLYTFFPYKKKKHKADLELFQFNPKHKGKRTFAETARPEAGQHLRKGKKKRNKKSDDDDIFS